MDSLVQFESVSPSIIVEVVADRDYTAGRVISVASP